MKREAIFIIPEGKAGGAERVAATIANELAEDPLWSVTLVTLKGDDLEISEALHKNLAILEFEAKREIFSLPSLLRYMFRKNIGMVFTTHTHINAFISLLRKLKYFHCDFLILRESTSVFERKLGNLQRLIESLYFLYGSHDLLIFQTSRMRESLLRHVASAKIGHNIVIGNPYPATVLGKSVKLSGDTVEVVWCGRFIEVKSPLLALEAFALMIKRSPREVKINLTMFGEGPLLEASKAFAIELGIGNRLNFPGRISNARSLFSRFQVGLITSIREGFPNVILEYVAAGIPAIASTDCAGDLHEVPGVSLVQSQGAEEIALTLFEITHNRANNSNNVQRHEFLMHRTPRAYLSKIFDECNPPN